MAVTTTKDSWLLLVTRIMHRLLKSRSGHLLLAVMFVGVLVLWANLNFSNVLASSSPLLHKESLYPFFEGDTVTRQLTPAEIEQQRRVAVFSRILQKQVKRGRRGKDTSCIHPKLDLKHDTNQFAYYDMPPLNCTGNGMFFSYKGTLTLNKSVVNHPALLGKCSFYAIERVSDSLASYAEPVVKESAPFDVSIPHDFVRIKCLYQVTVEENQKRQNEEKKEGEPGAADDLNEDYVDRNKKVDKDEHNENDLQEDSDTANNGEKEDRDGHVNLGAKNENQNKSASEEDPFDDYYKAWWDRDDSRFYYGDNDADWEDSDLDQFLVQIHPKPEVFQRISEIKASSKRRGMKLNILMFALDSMSHLCYERKLPKTYKYLKDDLEAAIMENYNIVGDATTAAIIPMMTGMTEMELPEVRTSKFDADTVDKYPLVWKQFQEQGYATLFAEDEPSISTFNLRFNGFQNQPTDHYMRPFWQALWDSGLRQNSEKYCTGNIAHHRFMLQYLEQFFEKYHNVSRFAFGFHGQLSHWDNNPVQYIDDELLAFLRRLKQGKFLEDTVLILFGDHGARYSKVRYTVQGKLEERLPMMSFVFPRKFRQQYPQLYNNLLTNVQRLTTPFDIHQTLLDIVNLSQVGDGAVRDSRGISLLREIPADRTCKDAGISMHWCTCLHQITLDTSEEFVKPAVLELMWHLNAQTVLHRTQCAELHLKEIISTQIVIPNEQVLRYLKSKDDDNREANFSREIDPDIVHYQIQVETQPCGGQYEATVMADFRNNTKYRFAVTPGTSRINRYGSQPMCVQNEYPTLRKFCCCKDFLETQRKSMNLTGKDPGLTR